ncbi:MAG: ATP-binding cassette domain-containing protein [Gammaproteobacteria bacterium]
MIELQKMHKSYGDVHAVNGLSLTANDGEITTLLGANGSGKSTTLRMLAGIIKPDGGQALVDSINVAAHPMKARRRLGMFGDQFGLYPRITAFEHLEYVGGFHGLSGKALKNSVAEISELLQMTDLLDRRTEGFSQGQRMKVALARTLVTKPQNLVLDEPTRGLDIMSMRLLRSVLKDLRDSGRCILLSSHVMADVEELSDKIVFLAAGQVVHTGSASELMAISGTASLEEAFISMINTHAA